MFSRSASARSAACWPTSSASACRACSCAASSNRPRATPCSRSSSDGPSSTGRFPRSARTFPLPETLEDVLGLAGRGPRPRPRRACSSPSPSPPTCAFHRSKSSSIATPWTRRSTRESSRSRATACGLRIRCSGPPRSGDRGRRIAHGCTASSPSPSGTRDARARHLALATPSPDPKLAAAVAAAAEAAAERGARHDAVELAEQALRLTPRDGSERPSAAARARSARREGRGAARQRPCSSPRSTLSRGSAPRSRLALLADASAGITQEEYRRRLDRALAESDGDPAAAGARAREAGEQRRRRAGCSAGRRGSLCTGGARARGAGGPRTSSSWRSTRSRGCASSGAGRSRTCSRVCRSTGRRPRPPLRRPGRLRPPARGAAS